LRDNFEAIDVYTSWKGDGPRIKLMRDDFERLWKSETRGLKVLEFPEAARKELLKQRPTQAPLQDPEFKPKRCPKCLEPILRQRIKQGIPVCSSCKALLPLQLVGFEHYIIEGCRVTGEVGGATITGMVLTVDYSRTLFDVLTDYGKRVALNEVRRIAFNNGQRVLANGVPAVIMSHAVREDDGQLSYRVLLEGEEQVIPEGGVAPPPPSVEDQLRELRFEDSRKWALHILASIIDSAPYMRNGEALLTASSKVKPYEHQLTVAGRIVKIIPPRFLLADEVGLGKTIEVGLSIKELQMRGQIERVLIVAPKLLVDQWIGELGRRFNIFCKEVTADDYADGARRGINPFNQYDFAITSYQFAQRDERKQMLLDAKPWDIIVVDEAHHIRREPQRGEKNKMFKLVDGWEDDEGPYSGLKEKGEGLLLVTATPLQLRIGELYDLLNIIELGGRWAVPQNFARFFEDIIISPSAQMPFKVEMARDFLQWGNYDQQAVNREIAKTGKYAPMIEHILFENHDLTPHDVGDSDLIMHLNRILTLCTPLRWIMFRNTREVLRKYGVRVPKRLPKDHLFPLGKPDEEDIYDQLTEYIRHFYQKSKRENRKALGFVMATYRKRLTSSFFAIRKSLERRREYLINVIAGQRATVLDELKLPEEQEDEEGYGEEDKQRAYEEDRECIPDIKEEVDYVERLLRRLELMTADTKLDKLRQLLDDLFMREEKVIIFTQYYDTLEYLRDMLSQKYGDKIVCYSGQGGEVREGEKWKIVSRDEAVKQFQREAAIMISTEAGSEGKNFQFCSTLVNFDLPWNPMRVEQRIGRIDRLEQKKDYVEIHNMFYENTIDGEVYLRLRRRIRLFETVVGPLHPILEKIEKYALEYSKKEALVRIDGEFATIEDEHRKALEIEQRAQEFLFAGFDKSILERFGVDPPISHDDVKTFVEAACSASNNSIQLTATTTEGLFRLIIAEEMLNQIRRVTMAYDIQSEMSVVFRPEVAEMLSPSDPEFQDVRLLAYGNPIVTFLLQQWRDLPESRISALIGDTENISMLFLYKAKLEGLIRREEIIPIIVDLDSLTANEISVLTVLKRIGLASRVALTMADLASYVNRIESRESKIKQAIKASQALWSKAFDGLNRSWINEDNGEYMRRSKILDGSFNRLFTRTRSLIEGHVRRLIHLKYIEQFHNVDRLPDGEIEVRQIAAAIENAPDLRRAFQTIRLDPSELRIRGDAVRRESRSFRTAKQRQALHLQITKASNAITSEFERYRKMAERIKTEKEALEGAHGRQATHSLIGAALLLPESKLASQN
jgi:ERCC4-related helicase